MISIAELAEMQMRLVAAWHRERVDLDSAVFESLVIKNHDINFRLWHEEDQARDPEATDVIIAGVKRRIDALNQQRANSIEMIDDAIATQLAAAEIDAPADLPTNTETPGSAIDRLSILALRCFHLAEQCDRIEIDAILRARVSQSLAIAASQRAGLIVSLERLITEVFSGRKAHRTFRQLKMYNDPELNPAVYCHQATRKTN